MERDSIWHTGDSWAEGMINEASASGIRKYIKDINIMLCPLSLSDVQSQ